MSHAHQTPAHAGYEPRDAHAKPLVVFFAWLFLGMGATLVGVYYLLVAYKQMPRFRADDPRHPLAVEREIPAEPRLEALKGVHVDNDGTVVDPATKPYFNTTMFKDWNAKWKQQLSSYGYVDPAAGVVRVPIERAMELKLRQGFPTSKPKN